jgi:hypothetical protein
MPVFLRGDTKVLFIHVPKTGGSTIEKLFHESGYKTGYLDGKMGRGTLNAVRRCTPQHMHARLLTTVFRLSAFDVVFTLVRDPVDRFRSELLHRAEPGTQVDEDVFNNWTSDTLARYASNAFAYGNHIRPQYQFNVPGCVVYRFEDGMEHIRSELNEKYGLGLDAEMPNIRDSKLRHGLASSDIAVPEQAMRQIVEFYQQDYATFNYELPDSYTPSGGPSPSHPDPADDAGNARRALPSIAGANDTLERVLGVRVLRARSVDALKSKAEAPRSARRQVRQRDAEIERLTSELEVLNSEVEGLNGEVERLNAKAAAKPKQPQLPADCEAEFAEIWESVRERTMTGHEKVYGLYHAVRYVVGYGISGAILECGVWRGGSMLAAARTLHQLGVHDRDLYLFDTFEGMTEPTDRDVQISNNKSAEQRLATEDRGSWVWAVASLEDVQQGFEDVSYPAGRIHFVAGPVEKTVPDQAPEQIAILRLDTDWYASTRHELEHLYHRLAPGGVLIIDDYGMWQGSKDATDEFLAATGEPLLLLRSGLGYIAVKPGLSTDTSDFKG